MNSRHDPRHRSVRRALSVSARTILLGLVAVATAWSPAPAQGKPARKPGVSFLLSAVLPGAGQLYNGDRRGYLYLGAEAAAWFVRLSYLDAGNRKEGEYEGFARRHWEFERWVAGRGELGCNWSTDDSLSLVTYREENIQQYYEAIGKKPQYRCGWDDFDLLGDPGNERSVTPNQRIYRDMRDQSNTYLDRARLAGGVLVVNRLISAVDAFRTARSRADRPPSSLRLESRFLGGREPRAEIRLVRILP